MKNKRILLLIGFVIAIVAASFTLTLASDGRSISMSPEALLGNGFTYQGYLTEGNSPANGVYDFEFVLYDAEIDGTFIDIDHAYDVSVDGGVFTVLIDEFDSGVFDGNTRWLAIGVRPWEETGAYIPLEPRQPITPSPYALYAVEAGSMEWNGLSGIPSGLGDGDDDSLATTSCNSGQVLKYIGSSWTCAEDAGGTDYTAGYGLVLNVSEFSVLSDTIQTRVNNNCPPDQSIREIKADGSVVCETDDNTIYTQGYGLDLVAGQFSVDTGEVQNRVTGTCIAGQSIRIINANGSVTCENDDNTIYSPGYGLDLVTGQFSVDTAEVQDRVDGVCPAGQSIRQINQDGSVVCEPDADTVDGYEGAALEESAEIDADIVRTRP